MVATQPNSELQLGQTTSFVDHVPNWCKAHPHESVLALSISDYRASAHLLPSLYFVPWNSPPCDAVLPAFWARHQVSRLPVRILPDEIEPPPASSSPPRQPQTLHTYNHRKRTDRVTYHCPNTTVERAVGSDEKEASRTMWRRSEARPERPWLAGWLGSKKKKQEHFHQFFFINGGCLMSISGPRPSQKLSPRLNVLTISGDEFPQASGA